jgi:hypothetical protein
MADSAKPKPRSAHAYQFGNTIIVEDEDGEVIKKYTFSGWSVARSFPSPVQLVHFLRVFPYEVPAFSSTECLISLVCLRKRRLRALKRNASVWKPINQEN